MPRRLLVALLVVVALGSPGSAQQSAPLNLDFESGTPGEAPPSWFGPRQQQGLSVRLDDSDRRNGQLSAVLVREPGATPGASLNLWQQFDATRYRGQRVRFRMSVRTDAATSRAQLWLRIEGTAPAKAEPPVLFLDNMDDRPIMQTTWADYDLVADVPTGAARIGLGVFLVGPGRAWVDAGSFETIGKAETRTPEGPRPMTRRGLLNVLAFTRLVGAIRHFYPGDSAAGADWDGFVVAGMRSVEASPDAASLVRQLEQLFRPIAPTVSIALSGALPPADAETQRGSALLAWRHSGFGGGAAQSTYRSERVPASENAAVDLELGGGVAARVPLTASADGAAASPIGATGGPYPTRQRFSVADRATRLAAVAIAWNVLQHFYPYFDVVKSDWSAVLRTALQEAAADRDASEFTGTLERLIAGLHDGQARVYAPNDAELQFIPPMAVEWVQNDLVVIHAAASLGLSAGDRVISIDGVPVPLALEGVEPLISGATPQWIRRRALQELLTGPRGSAMKLRLDRAGAPVELSLTRTESGFAPPPRLDAIAEPRPGIMYVDVTRLTDAALAGALPKLTEATGIVFDLRGTPAIGPEAFFTHLIGDSVSGPQWHIPQVTRPDREEMAYGRSAEWRIAPRPPQLRARKAFLTDERAIGFAESYAGIFEQYRLGEIVGGPTAGTSGAMNRFSVPGDYTILFTGTKTLKQDGSQHHGIGIRPTVPVTRTREGIASGRDEVLERAIEVVAK